LTRILTQADVNRVLTLDDCIIAVEGIFRAYGERRIGGSQSIGFHGENGTFHIKAALGDVLAVKINANFPGNPQQNGLPTIQGLIVVIDSARGTPLAILDSILITTLRTAAATAVAAKYLARRDAERVTIIGCGNQGRANLEALARVRTIRTAYAWDVSPEVAGHFAREMGERLSIRFVDGGSLDESVAASDIVVTCTPARTPLLDETHLHEGLFIAGVGADNHEKHELSPALLAGSRVVVDVLEQAATMGDLHHAIAAGVMNREEIHGELGDVLCGRVAARSSEEEIFVFDSTGTALQDLAAASMAVTRAVERGIGQEIVFA